MLGAIAGDIIASPYIKNNAQGANFKMFETVRGWSSGEQVSFYPRATDATVMTIAVARWLNSDPEHGRMTVSNCMKELHSI